MPPEFLTSVLSRYSSPTTSSRPLVTLTFAQSLDAKIAGQNGKQIILSGHESMVMTHWMRTMHDAILVGIGTALNDDPQLNVRHLPPAPDSTRHHLPRPIILDSHLRLPTTCKLLTNYRLRQGRRPWVLSSSFAAEQDPTWHTRLQALQDAGARVIQISHPLPSSVDQHHHLPIPAILSTLHALGIQSMMVEGGAQVIRSFFEESSVIDTIIVTVAPTFVGANGLGYGVVSLGMYPGFRHTRTEMQGRDAVVVMAATRGL